MDRAPAEEADAASQGRAQLLEALEQAVREFSPPVPDRSPRDSPRRSQEPERAALEVSGEDGEHVATSVEIAQLHQAMEGRLVIGQAQGVLMVLLDIDADQAFAYLRRVSSSRNVNLRVIAAEVVRTRQIPRL